MLIVEEAAKTSKGWTYRQRKLIPTKNKEKRKEEYISIKAKVKQLSFLE